MRKLRLALLALAIATPAAAQNAGWPPPAGAVAFLGVYNSGAPTLTNGQVGFAQLDVNGQLKIAGSFSAAGTTSNATSAVATSSTNTPNVAYNYGFNGTTWDQLQVDASKYLKVNCVTGCTGGNANGSATSANSAPVVIASDQVAVAVKAASGSVASGAIASGAVASGAVSGGAFASGALASGSIATGAMVDLLTMRGTVAAGTAAANSMLAGGVYTSTAPTLTTTQQAAIQVSSRGGILLGSGYPAGSTPISISGTGTTGATTATLATGASVTTYICGLSIRANATAAVTGNATVTGTITGTLNFTQWTAPTASGLGVVEQIFNPCIPASAVNTGIAVISAAPGTGGVVSVTA